MLEALERGCLYRYCPRALRSDQGSEYLCAEVLDYLFEQGIAPSFSAKSSPWQNGRQKSFFQYIEQEIPDLSQNETPGEAIGQIRSQGVNKNAVRIHISQRMPSSMLIRLLGASIAPFKSSAKMYRKVVS